MDNTDIKCHKCRHVLLQQTCLLNIKQKCASESCDSFIPNRLLYIAEDKAPEWIKDKVEEEQWTKGRLHCPKCNSRVGSFDYVSGKKCECGESVLPPIHLVTSQVDRPRDFTIH